MMYAIREIDDYTGKSYYTYFKKWSEALKEFYRYNRRRKCGECFACVDLMDMRTGEVIASL